MKNTFKKNNYNNKTLKTKNNNKTLKTKKCMETFVEKKVKYWTDDYNKQIKKLENNKNLSKEKESMELLKKLKKQRKNQITNLKKQFKLYNCNIDCKNTLLEPGPPNKIPKSMRKEYHNSKKLIKIFTKKRKDIFKNKTNVLVDNFYENASEQTKQNLLKEGAISDCILPINT
jgi:hypothetical protein